MEVGGLVILAAGLTLFWSAVIALIYRYTSRFAIGGSVSWSSGYFAALLGLPPLFGISGGAVYLALDAGLAPGSPPLIAIVLAGLVAALFVSALANLLLMRRLDGAKLSYGEACRVQLIPVTLLVVLAVISRL